MASPRNPALAAWLVATLVCASAGAAGPSDEPVLEGSVIYGTVFCDVDGDGVRQAREAGLGGATIVGDHGWEVTTDRAGAWHLKALRPGQHLVKLDATSLPGGSAPADGGRRRLYLTAGLPARADFPVRCALETVVPEPVAPRGAGVGPVTDRVVVSGRLDGPSLAVDGSRLALMSAGLELSGPGIPAGARTANLPWQPAPLREPLTLTPRVTLTDPMVERVSWRLTVARVADDHDQPVRVFAGRGRPPEVIRWEGTDATGTRPVLERGWLYRVTFELTDGWGARVVAPPLLLGASWGAERNVLDSRTLHGDLFDGRGQPYPEVVRALRGLRRVVAGTAGSRVLIEVHTDDRNVPLVAADRTRRAAFQAAERAVTLLKLPRARVLGIGHGSSRPLRPNVDEKNRRLNRRVEITVLAPERPDLLPTIPPPPVRARIRVQGDELVARADGAFARAVPRPVSGAVALDLVAADGMRWQAVVDPADLPAPADGLPAEDDPLRHVGGAPLREALGDPAITVRGPSEPTAHQLEVRLPPRDAVTASPRLFVTGTTHPRNRVTAGGVDLHVDARGLFGELVPLPPGQSELVIVSRDPAGYEARVAWPVQVADRAFFLLALADGAVGQLGAHIAGRGETTARDLDGVFLQGRAALHVRGRVRGERLKRDLFVAAHVDTARRARFEAFHEQVIDPARDYVLFGDAADDEQAVKARGPLWVLVRADRSRVELGNVRAGLRGVELVRYDRALYGALLHVEEALAPGWDTAVTAFASEDTRRLRRGHDELRATGGSLYYLSRRVIVEGSERLQVVVRERDTRLEVSRADLTRDADYRVDYLDGRVRLLAPLASTADRLWTIPALQPQTGREAMDGHEVWLVADYESADRGDEGEWAAGVHGTQRLADRVEVGGGFVREARGGDDYTLYGGQVAVDVVEGTRVSGEVAASRGRDGATRVSGDGGLRYGAAGRDLSDDEGRAFALGLDSDVGRLLPVDVGLRLRGWWHYREAGFQAQGQAQDRGTERAGGEIVLSPTDLDEARLRFDWTTTLLTPSLRARRLRWSGRYHRDVGPVRLYGEGAFGQSVRDDEDAVTHTGAGALGARWTITPRLSARLSQEAVFAGDDRIFGEGAAGRLTTRAGVTWSLAEDVALDAGGALRWDGDHGIRLGLRTALDDDTDAYVAHEISPAWDGGAPDQATVVGAETRLAGGGRAWGEYRLDRAVGQATNRAVVGMGRRFRLAEGVSLSGTWERTQAFGGYEGGGSRDVVSAGLEVLAWDRVKLGGRYEVRWDRNLEQGVLPALSGLGGLALTELPEGSLGGRGALGEVADREVFQTVASTGLDVALTRSLTALASVGFSLTQNLTNRTVERQAAEVSAGLVYRPPDSDRVVASLRYARYRTRQASAAATSLGLLLDERPGPERRVVDLVSGAAVLALPWRLQLAEKLVFRHLRETDDDAVTQRDNLLWLTRLGVRLLLGLDVAAEYRLVAATGEGDVGHGALVEAGWTVADHVRVGIGWDFSDLPRDLLPVPRDGESGFYLRVTGTY